MGRLTYKTGEGKKLVRRYLLFQWLHSFTYYNINSGTVPTLSFHECNTEKFLFEGFTKLKLPFAFKFLPFEFDLTVFTLLELFLAKNKLNYILPPENSLIEQGLTRLTKNSCPHLILDYCCFVKAARADIFNALNNDLVVIGGTIMITVSPRSNEKDVKCLKTLKEYIAKFGKGKYECVFDHTYNDQGTMVTVIVRRMK